MRDCNSSFGSGSLAASNAGFCGLLRDAVADADELEDGPGAGIAQARLGQAQDPGVAAGTIGEPRGDFGEQHAHGLLVAEQLQARGGGRRPTGAMAWFHLLPLRRSCARSSRRRVPRSAVVPNSSAASLGRRGLAGDRDALLDQRPHFLGLLQAS